MVRNRFTQFDGFAPVRNCHLEQDLGYPSDHFVFERPICSTW